MASPSPPADDGASARSRDRAALSALRAHFEGVASEASVPVAVLWASPSPSSAQLGQFSPAQRTKAAITAAKQLKCHTPGGPELCDECARIFDDERLREEYKRKSKEDDQKREQEYRERQEVEAAKARKWRGEPAIAAAPAAASAPPAAAAAIAEPRLLGPPSTFGAAMDVYGMSQKYYDTSPSLRSQLGRYARGSHECHTHYSVRMRTEAILRRCNISATGSSSALQWAGALVLADLHLLPERFYVKGSAEAAAAARCTSAFSAVEAAEWKKVRKSGGACPGDAAALHTAAIVAAQAAHADAATRGVAEKAAVAAANAASVAAGGAPLKQRVVYSPAASKAIAAAASAVSAAIRAQAAASSVELMALAPLTDKIRALAMAASTSAYDSTSATRAPAPAPARATASSAAASSSTAAAAAAAAPSPVGKGGKPLTPTAAAKLRDVGDAGALQAFFAYCGSRVELGPLICDGHHVVPVSQSSYPPRSGLTVVPGSVKQVASGASSAAYLRDVGLLVEGAISVLAGAPMVEREGEGEEGEGGSSSSKPVPSTAAAASAAASVASAAASNEPTPFSASAAAVLATADSISRTRACGLAVLEGALSVATKLLAVADFKGYYKCDPPR